MYNIVVSVVNERGFYYLKHHIQGRERRRYVGKTIPGDIERLKREFLRQFYCEVWDGQVRAIGRNYQKEKRGIPAPVRLDGLRGLGIAFTYNTQRIEGSTLTQADTVDLLAHGITPAKKSHSDTVEAKNHYDLFMRLATSKRLPDLTESEVRRWHKEIFDQTMIGEAGHIRSYRVGVVTNEEIEFAPPHEIPKRLAEFFDWLCRHGKVRDKNVAEFACMAHYRFVSIHPFGDGNGRISRLIMNYILLERGYPPLVIKNADRGPYFRSLGKSQTGQEEVHFLKWFMRYYIKENKQYR